MCKLGIEHRFCINGAQCRGGHGLFGSPRRWYSQQYVRRRCSNTNCRETRLKLDRRLCTWVEVGECLDCKPLGSDGLEELSMGGVSAEQPDGTV